MKLPPSNLLWCVLIVCLTLLAFTYLTRKSLCEIRYRDTTRRWRLLWPTNPLSSQPRRRATSAIQGLNCLDMPEALYEGVTSALVAPFPVDRKIKSPHDRRAKTLIYLHREEMNRKPV